MYVGIYYSNTSLCWKKKVFKRSIYLVLRFFLYIDFFEGGGGGGGGGLSLTKCCYSPLLALCEVKSFLIV